VQIASPGSGAEQWPRGVLFGAPPMTEREMSAQAKLATDVFLNGAAAFQQQSGR